MLHVIGHIHRIIQLIIKSCVYIHTYIDIYIYICISYGSSGVREFVSSGVREFGSVRVQEFASLGVRKLASLRVPDARFQDLDFRVTTGPVIGDQGAGGRWEPGGPTPGLCLLTAT